MTPFVITVPDNIAIQLGDVIVEFYGDPPGEAMLALYRVAGSMPADIDGQLETVTQVTGRLRELVAPDSLPAFDKLAGEGKLSLVVSMQMFAHLMETYGSSLGFQSGTSAPSPSGLPVTAATSAE